MAEKFDLNPFSGSTSLQKAGELAQFLAEPLFLRTDTDISNRTFNHWEKEGLIDNNREPDQRWRRFSFVEFVWIRLVAQMREIGVSYEAIREAKTWLLDEVALSDLLALVSGIPEAKKALLESASDQERPAVKRFLEEGHLIPDLGEVYYSSLQILIAEVVLRNHVVSLAVFPKGDCYPVFDHADIPTSEPLRYRLLNEPHARLSLTGILKEFLASDLAGERIGKLHILEENEARLLEIIHSGEYESVKIKFRDRKMHALELVKSQDTKKKIVDVLAEANYQDITIKTHKGMISKIENTIKIQLDKQ